MPPVGSSKAEPRNVSPRLTHSATEIACAGPLAGARTEPLTVVSLFCGAAGGWDLGLRRAGGYRTVAACEIDPWRRACFSRNFPEARMYDDVRRVTADGLRRDLGFVPSVIVGSPPCQSFSPVGRGRGLSDERGRLFFEFIRLVRECRPVWAAAENHPHIRTRGFDELAAELEAADYAVWPFVVRASDLGAPHGRARVWIICADTNRLGIREQPGGSRGADGQGQAVVAANDRDAPSKQMGGAGLSWADDWSDWNGGLSRHLRVADGLPTGVASLCRAAYGDSVVPQICEAIGRSMMRLAA